MTEVTDNDPNETLRLLAHHLFVNDMCQYKDEQWQMLVYRRRKCRDLLIERHPELCEECDEILDYKRRTANSSF